VLSSPAWRRTRRFDCGRGNGWNRRSAEAGGPTDGLPFAAWERSFALRLSDGKVCPKAAPWSPFRPTRSGGD